MSGLCCVNFTHNPLIKMSQGNSIFSNPNGSNGEAPANPFASLGTSSQKSSAASPFAAVNPTAEGDSPFGFAAEEAAPERPQAKSPEKRSQTPAPPVEGNPFLSAAASPAAEAPSKPATPSSPASSPFSGDSGFEASPPASPAPSKPTPASADNPLASLAAEATKAPAPEMKATEPAPQPTPNAEPLQPEALRQDPLTPPNQNFGTPPAAAPAGGHSTRQLELRAIFGAEGEMTRDEILTRAKGLPGIREVSVVGPSEAAATQAIGEMMSRFGFGGEGAWQLSCAGGFVDFVSGEGVTLAILREGRYSAGVWETLMIIARELGKLS